MILRQLTESDLDGCLALSAGVGWNQTAQDWRLFLRLGVGWGLFEGGGDLVATACVLPYEDRFAWVSMVIVREDRRRRGLGGWLLRHALEHLGRRGLTPLLDATPAGRELYLRLGFRDVWEFSRMVGSAPSRPAGPVRAPGVRPMGEGDLGRAAAWDRRVFGADRGALLESLRARAPDAALVAEGPDGLRGYLLGRDGRTAHQLGPLVAADTDAALALLVAALNSLEAPVYLDVPGARGDLRAALEDAGWALQRRFTRMVHGAGAAPGDPTDLYAIAGPELG